MTKKDEPRKTDDAPVMGIKPAIGFVAAAGAVFTLGALALFPAKVGLSVMFGALVATSNLWVLSKIVESLLTPDPDATAEGRARRRTTRRTRSLRRASRPPGPRSRW